VLFALTYNLIDFVLPHRRVEVERCDEPTLGLARRRRSASTRAQPSFGDALPNAHSSPTSRSRARESISSIITRFALASAMTNAHGEVERLLGSGRSATPNANTRDDVESDSNDASGTKPARRALVAIFIAACVSAAVFAGIKIAPGVIARADADGKNRDAEAAASASFVELFGKGFYEIPVGQEKSIKQERPNTALVYDFIHIPKTGGSFFNQVLKNAERRVSAKAGSSAFPRDVAPFENWATYPLVDTTKEQFLDTRERFQKQDPVEFFGVDRLRRAYDSGERMFAKGSYGMGLCDIIDAPCAYLTILREPVAQFLSHYKYSCLAGAEDQRLWNEDMKAKGSCDMDLLQWYDYLAGDSWLHLLAPGTGTNKDMQVEVAIKNLDKSCFRFLLNERFDDGLEKLTTTLPDFAGLNVDLINEHAKKNESPPLPDDLQARFQTFIEDEKMMNELRFRMKRPAAVYKHAKNIYERKWSQQLVSC